MAGIPAVGLLVGAAYGLLAPNPSPSIHVAAFLSLMCLAVWAWWAGRAWIFVATATTAFAAGGAILSAAAWHDAWQPSLRSAFDDLARIARAEADAEHRPTPLDDSASAVITGTLRADAAPSVTGTSLSIAVTEISSAVVPVTTPRFASQAVSGGVLATVAGTLAAEHLNEWRAGRHVRMPIDLRRPSRYFNSGVPDQEMALARRGSILVGVVKSGALVEVVARGSRLDETMGAARAYARRAIREGVGRWSTRSSAIVTAIVVGDRAGLDATVQRRLQEAGTYHVIAISGGNIAILAGVLLGAFRLAGVLGRTAMLVAIGALLAYASFVGGGASVDRATLMAVVYLAGRAIDQRGAPLNALAGVASCLVVLDPLSVADPAFVLTCGATLAILVVLPVVTRRPTAIVSLFAASVATETMLFPVGALVFSRVTFAGLILNFLAIPLMAMAQMAGLLVIPLASVSPTLAQFIGWIAHVGAAGLVHSAELVRFTPWIAWRVDAPPMAIVVAYYVALVLWWRLWRDRVAISGTRETRVASMARSAAGTVAVMSAVWILAEPSSFLSARGDGRMHVVFLDVGQGDATFVRFPRGATMLVDTGILAGSFDMGERVVAPALRRAGVRRLDYLVLTHGDPDHVGGAGAIVREFRPREVWEGVPVPALAVLTALRAEAERLGSRWISVNKDDRRIIDGLPVTVWHPPAADWERQRVRNDDSIVLELAWGSTSVLLTGDIGGAVERDLGPALPRVPLRVLKAPHHGSLTSSTPAFLAAAAARAAIISVGRANRFGHPAAEVLRRFDSLGMNVFRTDRDGAITLDIDGQSISVRTFNGAARDFGPAPVHSKFR